MNLQQPLSIEPAGNHFVREQLLALDSTLGLQSASESFYTAFHLAPERTVGQKLPEIGNGQWNIPELLTGLTALLKTNGELEDFEMEHDFPVLGNRTMLVSARRLAGADPQSRMVLLSLRDIAAQKIVELQSGVLATGYHAILASLGKAVIAADRESHITFMNSIAEKLTGWGLTDALQRRLADVFHIVNERGSQTVESLIASTTGDCGVVGLADLTVLIASDGGEWPIDGSAAPILDAAGRPSGVVLAFHDISNRRAAEQHREISEIRYRRLFEAAHDGILILDAVTAKVLDVNPFMTYLMGYPREHFLEKELWEIGVFKDAEMSKKAVAKLQRLGRIRYEDLPLEHRDGHQIPVEFVSNVYREGRRSVIQCNIRDITDRKVLTHSLVRATREAEAANRSKSEFLANMSHEIRTPMAAIIGFADTLLRKHPGEAERTEWADIIQRNALHLLELINDILDLSKVEAGQMKVESVSCNLPALVSEIVSLMRPRAAEKGLAFGVTFQGSIPRLIRTDPLRLRQILVNLLGNAVKFTESGRIDVRIADEGAGGPDIVLRVDVIDTGIGMTTELLGRLFVPFSQGDASITRKFGGTGLGLTISRKLAKFLKGDVTATSQPGVGSTFTLKVDGGPSAGAERLSDLNEATLRAPGTRKVGTHILLRGRILLVEDGADNQRLLQMQLGDAGASVTGALNGQIALDLAAMQTFDLILMDMQMPVLDGYAATAELRRRGVTTPIIALTAYAMHEDRDKCLASGADGYLSKPIDEEELLKTVHDYLERGQPPVPDSHAGESIAGAPPPAEDRGGSHIGESGDVIVPDSIKSSQAGNPRIMAIVPEFVAGLPAQVQKMNDLLGSNDLPGLAQVAHQLLGTCGGYGFAPVSEPARTVEQSIKAGHVESINSQVESLIQLIRRIDGYNEAKEAIPTEELT